MIFSNWIADHKTKIASAWLAQSLDVYPEDSRRFFVNKKNQFDNPVGRSLKSDLEAFLDGLATTAAPETLAGSLFQTLKIRAVQDMRPAAALGFLFALKGVLREVLRATSGEKGGAPSLSTVDAQIDQAALFAFEIYAKHREKVLEVRINDVKRQVAHLLKRSAFFTTDNEIFSDEEIGQIEPKPRRRRAPKRGSR